MLTACASPRVAEPAVDPRPDLWSGRVFVAVLGAAGLGGQVGWSRVASAAVGGSFASASLTLCGAMVGLAVGAAAGHTRSLKGLTLACATALALCPALLGAFGGLDGHPWVRLALTTGILALAHVPFGAVLPALAAARGRRNDADLYAAGALGSTLGAIGVGGFLQALCPIDTLGWLLAAGVLSLRLLKIHGAERRADVRRPVPRSVLGLAFGLGFLGLAAEMTWMRLLGFAWEASPLTYAWVTAAYVGGVALGSSFSLPTAFSAVLLAATALASPWAMEARSTAARLAMAGVLVGLPAAAFGAAFARLLRRGEKSGALFAFNAAGSALGPLVVWAFADWLPYPPRVLVALAVGYALLDKGLARCVALAAAVAWPLAPAGPSIGDYGVERGLAEREVDAVVLPFVHAGPDCTVAVTRDTRLGIDRLWIDRGNQGDTSVLGRRIPERLGRLPCAMLNHPPRRTAVVGLGLGLTLRGLVEGGAREIEVAELSAGVIRANRTVLADVNGGALDREGVRVRHADGRAMLSDAETSYDLIVVDMIYPSVAGAGALFSREFYALARRRLAPDGLFVHWIPCPQLAPEDVASVVAAFRESFPEGSACVGHLSPRRLILGLVGGAVAKAEEVVLGPRELARLAGDARPVRDADARLEHRSAAGGFGERTFDRVLAEIASPAWLRFAEAARAESRGEAGRARELYAEAARLAPGVTDAEFQLDRLAYDSHLERARAAASRRDEASMIGSLRAAAAHAGFIEGKVGLGDTLAARGRFAEAVAEFERAAAAAPRSADVRLRLALAASMNGDLGKARTALDVAAALRPDRPPAYARLDADLRWRGH